MVEKRASSERECCEKLGCACFDRIAQGSPVQLLSEHPFLLQDLWMSFLHEGREFNSELLCDIDSIGDMELPGIPENSLPQGSCKEIVSSMVLKLHSKIPQISNNLIEQTESFCKTLFSDPTSHSFVSFISSFSKQQPKIKQQIEKCHLTNEEVFALVIFCIGHEPNGGKFNQTFSYQFNKALHQLFPANERKEVLPFASFLQSAMKKLPSFTEQVVCYHVATSPEFEDFIKSFNHKKIWWPSFMLTTSEWILAKQLASFPNGIVFCIKTSKGKDVSLFCGRNKQRILLPFNIPLLIEKQGIVVQDSTNCVLLEETSGPIYPNTFRLRNNRNF